MFLGHFAAALAAKRVVPKVSLGTLFVGAQLADLVWPNLVLAGIEKVEVAPGITAVTPLDFVHYPWSHSLAAVGLWGALFAGGVVSFSPPSERPKGRGVVAAALALLVVSHWILDWISHRPDLPLAFVGERAFGLGLWQSRPWTLAVELGLLGAGALLYLRGTRARDRIGASGFWALVGILVAIYLASFFGPPPPSATVVAISAQGIWLFVLLAWWVDRHREPTSRQRG